MLGDQVLRGKNESQQALRTISCVYEESETCDERYFIRLVEKIRGVPSIYVHEEQQGVTLGLRNITFTGVPNPFDTTPGRFPTFISHMLAANAHVLLTGMGGDHLFCSNPDAAPLVADLLREGRLRHAHRECCTRSRYTGVPYFRLFFMQALRLAVARFLPAHWQYGVPKPPAWLSQQAQTHADDLLAQFNVGSAGTSTPSFHFQTVVINSLFRSLSTALWSRHDEIYVSHPYTHRPLVELCLAIPISQFLRNGETRSLMRRALAHVLPPQILKRKGKGTIYEALVRALDREWKEIKDLAAWQVCRRGYVDPVKLQQSLQQMRFGLRSGNNT